MTDTKPPSASALFTEWMKTRPGGVYQSSIQATEAVRLVQMIDAFAERRAAEAREIVARFMISRWIPTGHGDTIEDLLGELGGWLGAPRATDMLRAALKLHHDRQLQLGAVGLPDGGGGWIEIDNTAEYADSSLCELTVRALADKSAVDERRAAIEECISFIQGGRFLHDEAPAARFAKEVVLGLRCHFGIALADKPAAGKGSL